MNLTLQGFLRRNKLHKYFHFCKKCFDKGFSLRVCLVRRKTFSGKCFPIFSCLVGLNISAIGAAGFCWGAKVVVQLAMSENIQAAVLLHLSFVSVDDFKEVEAPIAILGAEIDQLSPPELVKQFEEILSSKPEADSFVKIYLGVAHGWTVRYNVEDKKAVQSAQEAHQDMLNFFVCF
ncbi:uncharacterized AIM2 family protein C30D10.14-like isoform X1 [Solanum tuberosum]|uniref:uncharacterized AIM2 family protein C30D10.14-like isoform X1 n=1 Tax=Solanum tuberosum TaxID=4113 RepID=UPI00073A381E|nr:PREDICTED: uncharacterized AIM2 family protein C30D10.14-like isoform X1 [Solanum tuberosum]